MSLSARIYNGEFSKSDGLLHHKPICDWAIMEIFQREIHHVSGLFFCSGLVGLSSFLNILILLIFYIFFVVKSGGLLHHISVKKLFCLLFCPSLIQAMLN